LASPPASAFTSGPPSGTAASSVSAFAGVPMSPVAPASPGQATDGPAPTPSSASSGNVGLQESSDASAQATQAASVSQPRSPGIHRGFNVAHAVAWHTGYAVGKAFSPRGHRA
jgi:hypothetical protein